MQISWRDFLKMKLAKRNAIFALGISIGKDTNHVVGLVKQGAEVSWVHACVFDSVSFKAEFSSWVKVNNLQGTPTYVSYTESWYQILQIDRPEVEESQIFDAIQWPLKELMTSDKEITYDFFDIPAQVAGNHKVSAVAIEHEHVAKLCHLCHDLQLDLKQIFVEELAMCELVHSHSEAVMTLVQEVGGELCLNIIKDNQLYLTRRLRGFDKLDNFSAEELKMGIIESLCIQIQRSLDFFTNQLRQAPVKHIFISIPADAEESIARDIEKVIDITVSKLVAAIELNTEVNMRDFSLNAVGAAMVALNMQGKVSNKEAA